MTEGSRKSAWIQALALLEVSVVALLVPLARMGFKNLAPSGLFGAAILKMGAGIIIVAPLVWLWCWGSRKGFKTYGFALSGWRESLKIGVLLSLLCAAYVGVSLPILRHAGVNHFTGYEPQARLIALLLGLPGLVLFVWILRIAASIARRVPTILAGIALIVLWLIPPALASYFGQALGPAVMTSFASVVVAGLGEELIFRGYIQSRLNEVLGRPFRFGDTQFGCGLFITSFLFGLVHVFNGVDFWHGATHLQWTWGLGAFLSGTLIFGYLREKTGSILSGAILHGNIDAWALIVANLR